MSVSMDLSWSVALRRCGYIPPQYVTRIDELIASGRFDPGDIPQPPVWTELPALSVSALMELQESQAEDTQVEPEKKIRIPAHWTSLDFVFPVFPHNSLRLYVTAHENMASIVGLKGVNIRNGLPVEDHPVFDPRQNFFMGSYDIGGTVVETSDATIQWMIVPPKAAAYDMGQQVGVAKVSQADGFSIAFHPHILIQRFFTIGSTSDYRGLESMRSLSPQAMPMAASKGIGAENEVFFAPGGTMAGNYPDNPSIKKDHIQEDAFLSFWLRVMRWQEWNVFAEALDLQTIEKKKVDDARKAQAQYAEQLGTFLNRGVNTNTEVTKRLQRVPGDLDLTELE